MEAIVCLFIFSLDSGVQRMERVVSGPEQPNGDWGHPIGDNYLISLIDLHVKTINR